MPVQTFKLFTDLTQVIRRDFALADPTLLRADNANPLYMGEWVQLDSNYKLVRSDGSVPAFAFFVERGRSDTQAIGKATVLFLGGYEAETLIYTATSINVGSPLEVSASVSYDTLTKSGLKIGDGTQLTVGYCTKIVSGGALRFIQTCT